MFAVAPVQHLDDIELRRREARRELRRRAGLRLEPIDHWQRRHLLRSGSGPEQQSAGDAGEDKTSHSVDVTDSTSASQNLVWPRRVKNYQAPAQPPVADQRRVASREPFAGSPVPNIPDL
jgi:hypothetical protein